MLVAKGTWTKMGGSINQQERGGSKRGPKGNYPCLLIPPTFFNFIMTMYLTIVSD
jgi:hypothetical protein